MGDPTARGGVNVSFVEKGGRPGQCSGRHGATNQSDTLGAHLALLSFEEVVLSVFLLLPRVRR